MSIMYCEKHDRKWDSDRLGECPSCENEPNREQMDTLLRNVGLCFTHWGGEGAEAYIVKALKTQTEELRGLLREVITSPVPKNDMGENLPGRELSDYLIDRIEDALSEGHR